VIYEYEARKIKRVWSVIDKAAIETQLFDPNGEICWPAPPAAKALLPSHLTANAELGLRG
jgi:hypothetical protein